MGMEEQGSRMSGRHTRRWHFSVTDDIRQNGLYGGKCTTDINGGTKVLHRPYTEVRLRRKGRIRKVP